MLERLKCVCNFGAYLLCWILLDPLCKVNRLRFINMGEKYPRQLVTFYHCDKPVMCLSVCLHGWSQMTRTGPPIGHYLTGSHLPETETQLCGHICLWEDRQWGWTELRRRNWEVTSTAPWSPPSSESTLESANNEVTEKRHCISYTLLETCFTKRWIVLALGVCLDMRILNL